MQATIHFDAGRTDRGTRKTVCGLESYTVPVTSLASQVNCGQCKKIDENGPNDDLKNTL